MILNSLTRSINKSKRLSSSAKICKCQNTLRNRTSVASLNKQLLFLKQDSWSCKIWQKRSTRKSQSQRLCRSLRHSLRQRRSLRQSLRLCQSQHQRLRFSISMTQTLTRKTSKLRLTSTTTLKISSKTQTAPNLSINYN